MQLVSLTLIHWIVIYSVDSAIQLLNNWGQVAKHTTEKYNMGYILAFEIRSIYRSKCSVNMTRKVNFQKGGQKGQKRLREKHVLAVTAPS